MHVPCTWLECEELGQMEIVVFHKYLMGNSFSRDTHETFYFASLYYLIHTFYTHTIYTHITHNCWEELLRENPNQKPWELESAIPTYLYTFACGFFSTPTSLFPYHWEVDPAKWRMCPTHDWNARSQDRWRQLWFASISRVRPSCETPTKYSVLPVCTIWYSLSIPTLYVPTLYIPTLSTIVEESFWEKTLTKNLES